MCEQVNEKIIIAGESFSLLTEPLAPLIIKPRSLTEPLAPDRIIFEEIASYCYRGYCGTWELKDNSLYLTSFSGNIIEGYLSFSTPTKAIWFSGKLRIPIKDMFGYKPVGRFNELYSEELEVEIYEGNISNILHKKFKMELVKRDYGYRCYEFMEATSADTIKLSNDEMIKFIKDEAQNKIRRILSWPLCSEIIYSRNLEI